MKRAEGSGLILVLLATSALLHGFALSEPAQVVFDEVHFGGYVNAYRETGAYFFDVHPPHAKLLIAGLAGIGGYDGGQSFERIHTPFPAAFAWPLRAAPALAGTALPVLVFWMLSLLGASRWAAFLGGAAIALDNALLLQTRLVALEGLLLASIFGALCADLRTSRGATPAARLGWSLLAGGLAGLAAGCKFTGAVALGMIALRALVEIVREPARLGPVAVRLAGLVAVALVVYLAGWAVHFALLTQPGPGDVWGTPTGRFFEDLVHVHYQMLTGAYGLTTTHPDASPGATWPLMLRPVLYWTSGTQHLYLLGNPVVWWGSSLGLLLVLAARVLPSVADFELRGRRRVWPRTLWLPLCGYALAFLPLVGLPRVMFLYHYFTALVFVVSAVALWLDHVGWVREGAWRDQRRGYRLALAALALGFALASPFTLTYVRAPAYQAAIFALLPGWR